MPHRTSRGQEHIIIPPSASKRTHTHTRCKPTNKRQSSPNSKTQKLFATTYTRAPTNTTHLFRECYAVYVSVCFGCVGVYLPTPLSNHCVCKPYPLHVLHYTIMFFFLHSNIGTSVSRLLRQIYQHKQQKVLFTHLNCQCNKRHTQHQPLQTSQESLHQERSLLKK